MDGHSEFERLLFEARSLRNRNSRNAPDPEILAALQSDHQFVAEFEKIGSGGMGCVYRTRRGESKRVIAVKIPLSRVEDAEQVQISRLAFWRECFAQASLSHPGIVPLCEFGSCSETELQPWMVMQFVEADGWRDYIIEARERLSTSEYQSELLRLVIELSKVIEYAHDEGVCHRDLKPENVKVRPDGHVYVMDWGLAQGPFDQAFRQSYLVHEVPDTLLQRVVSPQPGQGTLWYRAPEQSEGLAADQRSDVFACGRLLMQAFGVPEGEAQNLTPEEQAERHHTAMRSMPAAVRAIAERACAEDLSQRYGTAREFREDLDRVLAGYVAIAQRASAATRLGAWWRRHHPVPAVATVALASIVGIWSFAQSRVVEANEQQAETIRMAMHGFDRLVQTVPPQQLLGVVIALRKSCPQEDLATYVKLLRLEAELEVRLGREERAREIRNELLPLELGLPADHDEVEAVRNAARAIIQRGDVAKPRACWDLYLEAHQMLTQCYEKHPDRASLRDDLIWSYIRLANPARWRDQLIEPFSNLVEASDRLLEGLRLAELGLAEHPDERVSLHSKLYVLTRLGDLLPSRRLEIRPALEAHLDRFFALGDLNHTQLRDASNAWSRMAQWACDAGDHLWMLEAYEQGLPIIRRTFHVVEVAPTGEMLLAALKEIVKLTGLHGRPEEPAMRRELDAIVAIAQERGWSQAPPQEIRAKAPK